MMKDRLQEIFTIPRGVGFSRRLILAMGGVLISIIVLFLFFLHHYAPTVMPINMQPTIDTVSNQTASDAIAQLKRQRTHALIVTSKNPTTKNHLLPERNTVSEDTSVALSSKAFDEGSQSSISVYHQTVGLDGQPAIMPSHDYLSSAASAHENNNQHSDINQQDEKMAFLNNAGNTNEDTIDAQLRAEQSPYAIKAGTIIPATLVTGINSDLPGSIIAKVRRNVFDTRTGNFLLIPQGTTLIGVYDSQVTYGQSRVLIAWQRLIFPNSSSFDLKGMPGVDLRGLAGLHDKVNNHYLRLFGSALMFSVLSAAGQLSQPRVANNQLSTQQVLYAAAGQQLSQTGTQMVQKNMSIQPTLTIRPGASFNVLLTRDMVLPQPYRFDSPLLNTKTVVA